MAGENLCDVPDALVAAQEKLTMMVGHLQQAFQAGNEAAAVMDGISEAIKSSVCDHSEHTGYYRSDVPGKFAKWCKKCQTEQLVDESEVE